MRKKRLRQLGKPCFRELRRKVMSGPSTRQTPTVKLSYNEFRSSAKWVDCWACWALPARQKISKTSVSPTLILSVPVKSASRDAHFLLK